jgi:hypothetical protein
MFKIHDKVIPRGITNEKYSMTNAIKMDYGIIEKIYDNGVALIKCYFKDGLVQCFDVNLNFFRHSKEKKFKI